MKIEAMTEDEIRKFVAVYSDLSHEHGSIYGDVMRLIYTWAVAKAQAEYWESIDEFGIEVRLTAVLVRIGWPKDAQTEPPEQGKT